MVFPCENDHICEFAFFSAIPEVPQKGILQYQKDPKKSVVPDVSSHGIPLVI